MQIGNSAKSDEQALKMAMERMSGAGASDALKLAKLEFARLPEPLRTWFQSLTSFGWKLTLNTAKSELNSIWKTEVLTAYRAGLNNAIRYSKTARMMRPWRISAVFSLQTASSTSSFRSPETVCRHEQSPVATGLRWTITAWGCPERAETVSICGENPRHSFCRRRADACCRNLN